MPTKNTWNCGCNGDLVGKLWEVGSGLQRWKTYKLQKWFPWDFHGFPNAEVPQFHGAAIFIFSHGFRKVSCYFCSGFESDLTQHQTPKTACNDIILEVDNTPTRIAHLVEDTLANINGLDYSSSAGRKQHVTRMRFCVVRNLHWSAWMLFELASARWVWRSACTLEQSWAIHSSPGQGPTGPSSFCQKDSSWIGFIMIYWYLLSLHCLYSSDTFVLFAQPSKQRVGGNKLGFEGPGAARKSHLAVGASWTDGHQGWLQGSGRQHHTAPYSSSWHVKCQRSNLYPSWLNHEYTWIS